MYGVYCVYKNWSEIDACCFTGLFSLLVWLSEKKCFTFDCWFQILRSTDWIQGRRPVPFYNSCHKNPLSLMNLIASIQYQYSSNKTIVLCNLELNGLNSPVQLVYGRIRRGYVLRNTVSVSTKFSVVCVTDASNVGAKNFFPMKRIRTELHLPFSFSIV